MTDDATLLDRADTAAAISIALDATRAAPVSGVHAPASKLVPPGSAVRSTVLPRVAADGTLAVSLSLEPRTRYEPSKVLGTGGMGEVVLVSDHDIGRKVA